MKIYHDRNSDEAAVSWPTLLLILAILGVPFGFGFWVTNIQGASSVQIQGPGLTNTPPTLKMVQPRWMHSATLLPDGRVFIQGGYTTAPTDLSNPQPADTSEVFDPLTQTFSTATVDDIAAAGAQQPGPVGEAQTTIQLADTVLLDFALQTATLNGIGLTTDWDPNVGLLNRAYATATILNGVVTNSDGTTVTNDYNQKVLVVGGIDSNNVVQDALIVNPAQAKTDKDDYSPGQDVHLTGSGWKPGETVDIFVSDNETQEWSYDSTVVADQDGNFVATPYLFQVLPQHLGVTFNLMAVGNDSGLNAEVTFTDSTNTDTALARSRGATPSTYGDSLTFTATVTQHGNGNAITQGTVAFKDGNSTLASGVSLDTFGKASFTTTALSVGTHSITAVYSGFGTGGSAILSSTSGAVSQAVNFKALTITANSTSKTYGQTVTFAGTEFTTGVGQLVNGDTVTSVTLASAGASATATVTSPGPTYGITPSAVSGSGVGNYSITFVAGTLTVNSAALIVTPDNQTKTYGTTFSAFTGTLAAVVNNDGITATYSSTGAAAGAAVGAYDITASLNDPNGKLGNYSVTLNKGTLTVNKADTTTTVSSPAPPTYGAASVNLTATVTANSPSSAPVNEGTVTFTVKQASTTIGTVTSGTVSSGGASASFSLAGVTAGSYSVSATYNPATSNPNFNGSSSGTDSILTINKANAQITVTPYSVTYDGNPHTATGTATGVNGEDLSGLLDLGGTQHTEAGDYPADPWIFAGNANYNAANNTVHNAIAQADANIAVSGYTGVYDGNGHGATGSATGVKGEDLSGLLNLGASFTDVPGGTANWSFAGNTDYKPANGSVAISLSKADPTINVTAYDVTYDGSPHTAGGTATGVKGESLSGLSLTGTTHTVPESYANDPWTFTDITGNYNNASGSVTDVITKRVTVTTYTGPTSAHYGDCVTVSALVTDYLTQTPVSGLPVTFSINGTALGSTTTGASGTAQTTIQIPGPASPSATITATCGGDAYYGPSSSVGVTFNILPGVVGPPSGYSTVYTGQSVFWAPSLSSSASVTLTATIRDASANCHGDVRNAVVTFETVDSTGKETPITGASNLPVGLVNPGDTSVGTAGATIQYNLGNSSTATLTIRVLVNGKYYGLDDPAQDVPIFIAKATPGIIGGTGGLDNNNVAGMLPTLTPGQGAAKISVGVQYTKSGSNPQGGVCLVVCTGTKTYEIKSTAISTLSVVKSATAPNPPSTASFSSKCVINDVTNPAQTISIDGGALMQINITDVGGPSVGTGDLISISVQSAKTGATWYSSDWNGTQTIQKAINLNVLSTGNLIVQ